MKIISLKALKYKRRHDYLRSIIFDEKALRQKGVVFEIVKFLPGTKNQKHFHKYTLEIFFVKSGSGIIEFANIKYKTNENDILLIKPGEKHQVINNSKKNLEIIVFKISHAENDDYF